MNDNILDGFVNWTPLSVLSVSNLPDELSGVYIFTNDELIRYPKGNSDILYIGQTNNYRRRIFANYIGGVGGATTQRIHSILFVDGFIDKVKVGFKVWEEFKNEEKRLRNSFRRIYGALPLWNLQ